MSDTVGQQHGGLPASDFAMLVKTREAGGVHRAVSDTDGGYRGAGRERVGWEGMAERTPAARIRWERGAPGATLTAGDPSATRRRQGGGGNRLTSPFPSPHW